MTRILERIIPEGIKNKFELVNPKWYIKLRIKELFSRKIKVGFGPIKSDEKTLSTRKWHIDPIVNYINKNSKKYIASVFFETESLEKYDIIIIVKNFDKISNEYIKKIKSKKKRVIYHVVDNPVGCKRDYHKEFEFIKLMNGIIISNPLQGKNIDNRNTTLIGTPVIKKSHKKSYNKNNKIRILWEGRKDYIPLTKKLDIIIKNLSKKLKKEIEFIYFTNLPSKDKGLIKYIEWNLDQRDPLFNNSDIAVSVKPNEKLQQEKPWTKIQTYMASGLPVICTPSVADKLIIENKKTGFFAYSNKDWQKYLTLLIKNPELREKIGKAGMNYVRKTNSIANISKQYIDFFNNLR